jgi:hypothetical protein
MMSRKQPVPVPVVTDHFVNIYKPQDDGSWFISSTDYPHRGINIAPLEYC